MPLSPAQQSWRREVESLVDVLAVQQASHKDEIRAGMLATFIQQLDGKLANLQEGESLAMVLDIAIIGRDGKVRGGSGSQRNMPEYKEWRAAVFARDGYTCQECGSTERLNAHHVKPWAANPTLRFDIGNGTTLCFACHVAKHPHLKRP